MWASRELTLPLGLREREGTKWSASSYSCSQALPNVGKQQAGELGGGGWGQRSTYWFSLIFCWLLVRACSNWRRSLAAVLILSSNLCTCSWSSFSCWRRCSCSPCVSRWLLWRREWMSLSVCGWKKYAVSHFNALLSSLFQGLLFLGFFSDLSP